MQASHLAALHDPQQVKSLHAGGVECLQRGSREYGGGCLHPLQPGYIQHLESGGRGLAIASSMRRHM